MIVGGATFAEPVQEYQKTMAVLAAGCVLLNHSLQKARNAVSVLKRLAVVETAYVPEVLCVPPIGSLNGHKHKNEIQREEIDDHELS